MTQFEVRGKVLLPLERVWQAHEDVRLLAEISPPFPPVRLLSTPVACTVGTQFTVRLDLPIFPLDWQVEITHWEPPQRFVDRQVTGPFTSWVHTHRFAALSDCETLLVDTIEFEFLPLLDDTVILWGLQALFEQRMQNLQRVLAAQQNL